MIPTVFVILELEQMKIELRIFRAMHEFEAHRINPGAQRNGEYLSFVMTRRIDADQRFAGDR